MSDSSPLDEPLLSKKQTIWLFVTLGWFVIGGIALATGRQMFGAGWLLLGFAGIYRIYNPG